MRTVIYKNDIITLERSQRVKGLFVYLVMGLNIFTVNGLKNAELERISMIPFANFISNIFMNRHLMLMLGSLGIKDFLERKGLIQFDWNQLNKKERKVFHQSIMDKFDVRIMFGDKATAFQTNTAFYRGAFYNGLQYENPPSLIIKTDFSSMDLKGLLKHFSYADAVLFLPTDGTNDLTKYVIEQIDSFTDEESLLQKLLEKLKFVLLPQGDMQYLEFHVTSYNIEKELISLCDKEAQNIKATEWYKKNKGNFAWDDSECCYVIMK